ncbi:hypothetical protein K2X96_01950 [Patescibacteria group bacterium]|nr:hypothetical protein [Patescibacteria group bacterium]
MQLEKNFFKTISAFSAIVIATVFSGVVNVFNGHRVDTSSLVEDITKNLVMQASADVPSYADTDGCNGCAGGPGAACNDNPGCGFGASDNESGGPDSGGPAGDSDCSCGNGDCE